MADAYDDSLIPASSIRSESSSHELATSPDMQPYLAFLKATNTGIGVAEARAVIAALPLEKRYVWRVASALKWAFADFEDVSLDVDRGTMTVDDAKRLVELLRNRPVQFCMLMKTLLGAENMEGLMLSATKTAKETE